MKMPPSDGGVRVPVARPAGTFKDTLTVDASGDKTAEFTKDYTVLRIVSDVACYYEVNQATGTDATSSDNYLPAGVVEYIYVNDGDFLHVLRTDTDGTMWVRECA